MSAFLAALLYSYFQRGFLTGQAACPGHLLGGAVRFPAAAAGSRDLEHRVTIANIPIFTNLTSLPVIIFPVAIAYSITRHNLFDVDVYIKRAVGYGLMTAVLGVSYLRWSSCCVKAVVLSDTAE